MVIASVLKNDIIIADEVELANKFFTRFMGLMFRKTMAQNHGLLLSPCNSIHTFSMKFAIDAVFLASDGKILQIEHAMPPGKIGKTVKNAVQVLELCAGISKDFDLQTGDTLKIIEH